MQSPYAALRGATSSAQGVLGFGFTMLFCGATQKMAALLGHLLCGIAVQLLHALPCLFLVAWRLLGTQAYDLERFLAGFRLLVSLAPLAHCLLSVALR